ncbi:MULTISPECIES: cytochrome P450 [Bacillus]|uniref:Cytochrome P450 n=1 Tax=Bacillus glycinifermentans TaxID=1664069 RepID=A0AAJ3YWH8_9BACI|nr:MULTISPECIES: cytochrome P450 [Bacillus]KKB74111.1 cytochrome P450 [Bacillus sp. TH008]MDU0070454.1 cytochrome P450 [Bacillus sp. IG6]MED8018319.1 cytochrome P450 [Bacillus glycinifermentans]NUJ16583.1 cytochrome P450 [Bacillus glycinifermentans]QAT64231.1 cytochrome P450 [Bacillus glycinifermentans]
MTTELDSVLGIDRDFWREPYPFYDKLRSIDPVYKGTVLKQPGWYVTGHNEAMTIFKDARFKNRIPLPETSTKYEALKNVQQNMLLFKNDSDHKRMRTLVGKEFTPKAADVLRPFIKEAADELLDQLQTGTTADIVSQFAFPLASLVIARILGVPKEERHQFRQWTANLIETIDFTRSRQTLVKGSDTASRLTAYVRDLISKRKAVPQDDLITTFISAGKLTEEEVLATCVLLVIAGHETTVNLISNGLLSLMKHPAQLGALKENPELITSAVEEFLRYESPTQLTARTASEDCGINGHVIRKGEQVYILLGAANRDPNVFDHPHVLDIERHPNPHLAFGYGAHVCPGSSLARLEAQIAIQALLERAPGLRLAGSAVQYRRLLGFRALASLPVILN